MLPSKTSERGRKGNKINSEAINTMLYEFVNDGTGVKIAYKALNDRFPMSERTFFRYWNKTIELYQANALKIRDELLVRYNKEKLSRLRAMPMSKDLIVKSLQVIMDDITVGYKIRIDAMRLICDIEGYKAPTQNQVQFINPPPVFGHNPLIDNTIDITHTELISNGEG